MSENDLWNMLSREDQEWNGRAWSLRMAVAAEASSVDADSNASDGRDSASRKDNPCQRQTDALGLERLGHPITEKQQKFFLTK